MSAAPPRRPKAHARKFKPVKAWAVVHTETNRIETMSNEDDAPLAIYGRRHLAAEAAGHSSYHRVDPVVIMSLRHKRR